jgi:hypothetical protein
VFFFLLVYIYAVTILLLLFIQDNLDISSAAIDTYVYVMFGALSVDTTFGMKYGAIVIVVGIVSNKRHFDRNCGHFEYDHSISGEFVHCFGG